jgi:tRNA wybutosine-synthesizing protein 1
MISENVKKVLMRQHYALAGRHSAIQVCRWTKKSLLDEGECYKQKFYGIQSHRCCQMSPAVMWCQNRCLHCWRAIELTIGHKLKESDEPKEIIDRCIEAQKKMLIGFKGNKKINLKKLKEAMEPMQFAISLSGEPTIYPKIGELIAELRKRGKTTFLVTNGLMPERLREMQKKKQLPTQLYLSLNAPDKELFLKFTRPVTKNAWKKFNETIKLFPKLKTRKVIRINLVKNLNMDDRYITEFAEIIKKAKPDFVEVKAFMSVGYSRQRLAYDRMPLHNEIMKFSKKLAKLTGLKVLDQKKESRVAVLGKNKNELKIKAL